VKSLQIAGSNGAIRRILARVLAATTTENVMGKCLHASLLIGLILSLASSISAQAAGPADGLYLMLQYAFGSLQLDAYYFKGGQVARSPQGNVATLDFAALKRAVPWKVGTVAMTNDIMEIRWGDGSVSKNRFEPEANGPCFGFDAGTYCPVSGFKPGDRLNGSFEGGLRASGERNAATNGRKIDFTADGHYSMDAVGSLLDLEEKSGQVLGFSSGTEQGTYELNDTALSLHPAGRKAYVVLTFPYDIGGDPKKMPDHVYFGGTMLKRL
jgi:hypothetical protein